MPPLIEIQSVVKAYPALRPLRIAELSVEQTARLILRGFDEGAAEMFVHLVTGAALPDEGHVRVLGRDTRDIATDTEWLKSLDRFGIVTHRAVLIEKLSLASNLALPMTLAIDPMSGETRTRVTTGALEAGLEAASLDRPVNELDEEGRLRLHLARAVSTRPELVMLEHPTSRLTAREASTRIGQTLRKLSESQGFGFIALTEDELFASATAANVLKLDAATGRLAPPSRSWLRKFGLTSDF